MTDVMYIQLDKLEKKIAELQEEENKIKLDQVTPAMSYEEFLNHFETLGKELQINKSPEVINEIARTVFLNLTVKDKKVCNYELREPYKTYQFLGNYPTMGG
jgi:hypothetical protein